MEQPTTQQEKARTMQILSVGFGGFARAREQISPHAPRAPVINSFSEIRENCPVSPTHASKTDTHAR